MAEARELVDDLVVVLSWALDLGDHLEDARAELYRVSENVDEPERIRRLERIVLALERVKAESARVLQAAEKNEGRR